MDGLLISTEIRELRHLGSNQFKSPNDADRDVRHRRSRRFHAIASFRARRHDVRSMPVAAPESSSK
jgi:hypothetical protein